MSFWSGIQQFFIVTEKDVIAIILKVREEAELAAHEISAALGWIADNTPAIAADIQEVLSIVQAIGIVDPRVDLAVTAAHEAIAALDAYATAYKSGTGTAQAVVSGYAALKQAQGAAAQASAVAVVSK